MLIFPELDNLPENWVRQLSKVAFSMGVDIKY